MRHSEPAAQIKSGFRFLNGSVRNGLLRSLRSKSLPEARDGSARCDEQIRQDVVDELNSERTIDAAAISVGVEHGLVSLAGCADGTGEKWLIEAAARRIAGVTGLAVEIDIIGPEPGMRTDEDIRRDCEHALGMTVAGANHAITAMVSSGWVTLSGNVAWGYERWTAEEVVSSLAGVIGINGQIRVRSLAVEENVHANIRAALCGQPGEHVSAMQIRVDRNRVTLSGPVTSLMQRRAAVNAAWSTEGVKHVVDHTTLI